MTENTSQFILYQTEDGQTKLDVRFQGQTVWLSRAKSYCYAISAVGHAPSKRVYSERICLRR